MIKEKHYPYAIKKHKLKQSSIDIAYMDEGQGAKTILFLHGLGHSALGWVKNIKELKNNFRCIAIDLPGNGLSSFSNQYPYSIHFFARCIHDFIEEMELDNVYLVGHSMGGQIALMYAHLFPESAKGLILCAPAGLEVFNSWEKTMYKSTMQMIDLINTEEQSLKQAIQNSFYKMPKDVLELTNGFIDLMHFQDKAQYKYMLESCMKGMLNEPVAKYFSKIKVPVFVIFGEHDNLIPNKFIHPTTVKYFATKAIQDFPNAELFILPNCGHFLQWEKPEELNAIIEKSLNK